MNAAELATTDRALIEVSEGLGLIPVSERSLRRALEPDGDLADLALRVGRRVFLKVERLRLLLGSTTPDTEEGGSTKAAHLAESTVCGGPHNDDIALRAV